MKNGIRKSFLIFALIIAQTALLLSHGTVKAADGTFYKEIKTEKKKKAVNKKENKKKNKKKKKIVKKTLIIGDSVAYGMSLGENSYTGVKGADDYYWVTEGGTGIGLIDDELHIILGKTMPESVRNTLTKSKNIDILKEVKRKKIKNIVIGLGLNGLSEFSAKNAVKRMKRLKKKTKCRVFFLSVMPVVNKGIYKVRDSEVVDYNRMIKEGIKKTGIIYIDAYKVVKKQEGYENMTNDGIHYSSGIYNKVFKEIIRKIKKEETEEKKLLEKREEIKKDNKQLSFSIYIPYSL